jgi:polysaccharide export outer membrane protein
MKRLLLLVSVFLCWSIPARAQEPVLSPGDVVRISVWRKPDLSGDFPVAEDSTVANPFYSSVKVAGVPISVAQERVRRYVEQFETSPRVLVEPLLRVTVGGEVRIPNLYTLRPETTVSQAVALAGGPTERGQLSRVQVVREGRVDMLDLTDPAPSTGAQRVRSGDQILVSRRNNLVRDYLFPSGGIVAALVGLMNLILR